MDLTSKLPSKFRPIRIAIAVIVGYLVFAICRIGIGLILMTLSDRGLAGPFSVWIPVSVIAFLGAGAACGAVTVLMGRERPFLALAAVCISIAIAPLLDFKEMLWLNSGVLALAIPSIIISGRLMGRTLTRRGPGARITSRK